MPKVLETREAVYLIVHDAMSGRRGRFTVHRVSKVGLKSTKVIGRELTIAHSHAVVSKHMLSDVISRKRHAKREC